MPARKKTPARKPKAGASKEEAAHKRALFVEAFIANGGNATEAAKTAGYSAKTAKQAGSRLLTHVDVQAAIAERRVDLQEKAELTTERVLRELARIAFADPRRYFAADGSVKSIRELDDDAAAALSGIDVVEMAASMAQVPTGETGKDGKPQTALAAVPMYTKKVRMWDKNAALEKAMKHLGLFEKDNDQIGAAAAKFIYVPQKGTRARS